MVSFKGAHFLKDIILTCVRWYVAYPLSYRQVEELMGERGVSVDHATIQRWVLKYSPQPEEAFHQRKRPVWHSWRMDETYIKVKGGICRFSCDLRLFTCGGSLSPAGPSNRHRRYALFRGQGTPPEGRINDRLPHPMTPVARTEAGPMWRTRCRRLAFTSLTGRIAARR